jgi:HK97 family phage major capsid protein
MSGLRRVIQAAQSAQWAILPEKLEALFDVLDFQAKGGQLSADQIRAAVGERKSQPMQGQGVAVLPLYGIIGQKMNAVQDVSGPGGTSTEQFTGWFKAALSDPSIGSIVIDVDSPGGTVQGVQELAELIHASRGQKPIIAMANSMAASAAYWIASAADEVWVTPSGEVGSIGVFMVHRDLSAAFEEAGIKTTVIKAGKHKAEGMAHEPLSEETQAYLQDAVNERYTAFTKAVAAFRGIEVDDVVSGYGEGRVVSATKAKRLGMVDRIGTMDTLLGRMGATGGRTKLRAEELVPVLHASAMLATSDGEAVGAAEPIVVLPPESAEQAKEQPMSEKGTEATAVADQEKVRLGALGALAKAEKEVVSVEMLSEWIANGTTEAQASREVLSAHRSKANLTPIAPTVRPLDGGDNGTKAGPFNSLGEQLRAIVAAGSPSGRVDPRLLMVNETYSAASGASATVGADGGFLIQKDHGVDLMAEGQSGGVLSSRCSSTEISANADGLEVVQFENTSRATGSRWGGVQVYRRAEAETVTATKPALENWALRLEDMMGLAYVTDRLSQDASALGQVFSEAFRDEFAFKIDDEIFRGNGVGQCQGILNAPATVSVAKETGQLADTIVAENVMKMWSRVHPRSRGRGIWVYNVECDVQLQQMMIGTGTSGQLVYMPPGGLSGAQYGSIYGRPVIAIEHASALGDVGDIAFLDLTQYKLITKGGISEDESIHVRFLYNEKTLRWNTRINGAPKVKSPITPYKGTATLSPFVTLAARA